MRTAVAVLALLLLTGCGKEIVGQPNPEIEDCYTLYEHEVGDDESQDKYIGVYCQVEIGITDG